MHSIARPVCLTLGLALILQVVNSAVADAQARKELTVSANRPALVHLANASRALQVSPAADSYTSDDSAFAVTAGQSGAWYDPSHDGEGYVLQILSKDTALVYWFTYDQNGKQRWMIGVGSIQGAKIVFDELLTTSGGKFGPDFDPADVEYSTWGTLEFEFTACDRATASYAGPAGFGSGSLNLQRLSNIWGQHCDGSNSGIAWTGKGLLNPGFTGSWYDPAHDGEGFTVEILDEQTALIYWFTYDPQGNQAWMLAVAEIDQANILASDVLITSGGKFGPDFNPDEVVVEHWGEATFTFEACAAPPDAANPMSYQPVADFGPASMQTLERLASIAGLGCNAGQIVGGAPRIDAGNPVQWPIAGATLVTVWGAGFSGASVTLDGAPIAPSNLTDTMFQFTTPQHDNGYALLQITNSGGSAAAEYLYIPPKLEDLPPGYITTIAGVGDYLRFHLPANTASVRSYGLAIDAQGNILFGSPNADRILKVRNDGTLEPFAGNGLFPSELDNGDGGPAIAAGISFCRTVSLDGVGNAYIPDEQHRIRRVDAATGIITTIAGTGEKGFSGDGGPAKDAQINQPNFLAADADGTLYFGDHGNARIRKISTAGVISTIAGTGVVGSNGDGGPATEAQLDWPKAGADADEIALDRTRQLLYVAEYFPGRIRRIDLRSGIITAFFAGEPPAFPLVNPWGLTVDSASNVYVASKGQIVKLDPEGHVLQRWGSVYGYSEDGTPLDKMLIGHAPGLAVEADGNILFSDVLVARLRRMNFATGKLETVAGIAPRAFGVPGPAIAAVLIGPAGDLAFLPSGDLLFGDTGSIRIFRIDPAGQITEFGGTGMNWSPEPRREGMPISRISISPVALAPDAYGGIYTCDSAEIDYIDPDGIFYGVTKPWPMGYAGDGGLARDALLMEPFDVTLDIEGNLYIADSNNNRIRRVDRQTGIITTVAGSGPSNELDGFGQGSYCGDGGPALEACFNSPMALAVDPDGNIFVQDFYNHRIRKIDTRGIVSTFANEQIGGKIVADAYGGLFVSAMQVILRYLPDGTFWEVAGTYERGFSGDGGPAREARITAESLTAGLAVDREGNLFFHDVGNRRIRAVRFGAVLAPPDPVVARVRGSDQTAALGASFTVPLEISVKASWGSPAPGVRVDFQAPSSVSSCVFVNGTKSTSVLTDRSGKAQAICRASGSTGSYDVSATPLGSDVSVTMHLTNMTP